MLSVVKTLFGSPLCAHGGAMMLPGTRSISWSSRTHYCGCVDRDLVGCRVSLAGWIHQLRMDKFILLRDCRGLVQLIIQQDSAHLWSRLRSIQLESVLQVSGTVILRPEHQRNLKMSTGDVEVAVDAIDGIHEAQKNLPFLTKDFSLANESLRLKYRYLDLRRSRMQDNLRLRSELVMKIRGFLHQNFFVDVETPTLFRRTPGGAQEFLVPTRLPDKYYSLVQSPQQFKQLLMVAGLDRYYQIARCYRDEGARPDRQPEFTQVDLEMSFTDRNGIISMMQDLLMHAWPAQLGTLTYADFPRMTYRQCRDLYGTDKPDLRLDARIVDISQVARLLGFPDLHAKCLVFRVGQLCELHKMPSNAELNSLIQEVKLQLPTSDTEDKLILAPLKSLLKKCSQSEAEAIKGLLCLQPQDVAFVALSRSPDLSLSYLGRIRCLFRDQFVRLQPNLYKFLWVEDFPLFLPGDSGQLESAHHPFTMPHPEDAHLLHSDPLNVRGLHYDLVLNGFEIGGGSIRIHDPQLQRHVLHDILHEDCDQLSHLLEALGCGCPPHGGIALGLDRLVAIMCQAESIRDVIAFPKTTDGKDPMSGAPAAVRPADKLLYHLK